MKHALILPPPEELRNPKISLQMRGMTPAEIETFYREAHAALGCTRDPRND